MLGAGRTVSRYMLGQRLSSPARVVAIIGATGTGKSQLAVELASRYNGEVINCDAVQMYEGLPIITNKITTDEQKGIPHHLLGCISIKDPTWTVGHFVLRAREIIDEIRGRGKLPILVGGTHYYVQSLLVKESILDNKEDSEMAVEFPILQESTDTLLGRLRELDPVMADRWHPNERRKIQRSLEICLSTGRRASDLYAEQKQHHDRNLEAKTSDDEGKEGEPFKLNYEPLVFWIHAEHDELRSRLDKRVMKMIQAGLLDEVRTMNDFKTQMTALGQNVDLTKGIWVSIGFKEFADYLAATIAGENAQRLKILQKDAVLRTQAATRRYAKRQIRWIQYKFINAMTRTNASQNMFLLDGSNVDRWLENVQQPAEQITSVFLEGRDLPEPNNLCDAAQDMLTAKREDLSHARDLWQNQTCEACGVTAVTIQDWQKHIQSNRHKKITAAITKRKRLETDGC